MRKTVSLFVAIIMTVCVAQVATAAAPLFLRDFKLHDFDGMILSSLGYDAASVTYIRELASVTEDQVRMRQKYEAVGCHPFYVFRNGKAEELGYNCRSFYCVGYSKGPKMCRDIDGKPNGGVVEINRRLGLVTIQDIRKPFTDYAASEQTSSMKAKVAKLAPYKCVPLYLLDFDVVVGEGYECEEVGTYPQYSAKNICMEDLRKNDGLVCQVPLRADEMEKRAEAIARQGGSVPSSSSSESSSGTGSSVSSVSSSVSSSSSESSESEPEISFPDVVEGKYGYTAIMDLADRGIIRGYGDGLFRPKNAVNRAEFTKVVVQTLHEEEIRGETRCFRDVRDEWFSGVVCAAKRLGWIMGYKDNNFRPGQTMTKAEAMKVIVNTLGAPLDSNAVLPEGVQESHWATPYIKKAVELEIILEPSFQPNAQMTRADAAVWLYRALKAESSGLLPHLE
jgi:hypothetical protein